jgi:hypothetical protein
MTPSWRISIAGNNKMCLSVHVECPVFFPNYNQICISSIGFHKSLSIPNFTKFRPEGTALMYADRRAETTKVIDTFGNHVTAPKNKRGVQPLPR